MKVLAFFVLAVVVCAQADDVSQKWAEFQAKFGKTYRSPVEASKRFAIFQNNLKDIEAHNDLFEQGEVSYTKGINQFTDWTHEEFVQYLNNGLVNKPNIVGSTFNKNANFVAPTAVDWRDKKVVTPVKNQGQCGSCWAFSTTGSLEGQLAIVKGNLISLSEQNLMDCSTSEGNMGCNGGLMTSAFEYIKKSGIERESDYPYEESDDSCRADSSKIVTKVSDYVNIPQGDEDALQEAIATKGPVSVAIDASDLSAYDSGIYNDRFCSSYSLDHGVLAVGYGSENGKDYYIVKNSWGTSWGESGYFRLLKKDNLCGIATMATYPVL